MAKYIKTEEGYKSFEEAGLMTAFRVERCDCSDIHTQFIKPNVFYIFPEMTRLWLDINQDAENPYVAQEYRFRFTSGATPTELGLPSFVLGELEIEANKFYEVSILDGYLVSQSWEVS